ncbi:MAG TPA: hypothetical protein VLD86_14995, partial [Ilumatobacteraceae bacterium]|nr:hypothetical protein [Ilumatobacteraceae bacterium]
MRPLRGVAGSVVLLLGVVGCGGAGTTKGSTAESSTKAAGADVTLEACPGVAPGLFAIDPSGALRW